MQEYFIILLMDLTDSGRDMNGIPSPERNMVNTIWKTSWISRDVFNLPDAKFLSGLFNFSNTHTKKNYL